MFCADGVQVVPIANSVLLDGGAGPTALTQQLGRPLSLLQQARRKIAINQRTNAVQRQLALSMEYVPHLQPK
jgi:hypothetical protein